MGIFVRDKPDILAEVLETSDDVKDWGNGVFSWALPSPAHRNTGDPLCIEMLYPDEILRLKNAEGRRLYLKSEFDQESGFHSDEQVHYIHPKRESLVAEDVFPGRSKSLTEQMGFAQMVKAREAPFEALSFEAFKSIFDTLNRIYQTWHLHSKQPGSSAKKR